MYPRITAAIQRAAKTIAASTTPASRDSEEAANA
jgi:hypothetical protein